MYSLRYLGKRAFYRLYQDLFMSCRLPAYEACLRAFRDRDYRFIAIEDLVKHVHGDLPLPRRCVIVRHDIDTDVETARQMFRIESALGIRSSYYFRLCTVDIELMHEIAAAGNEVGYHFEEIASVAKKRGLASAVEVDAHLDDIRELFRANLLGLRRKTGLPLKVVASHGDFANRFLGIGNHRLLTRRLREELAIEAEVYDPNLLKPLSVRVVDAPPPDYWRPVDPMGAVVAGSPVVYILVHPKQWRASPIANLNELTVRSSEAVTYWTKRKMAALGAAPAAGSAAP